MSGRLDLSSEVLEVEIDSGRGADVLSVVHRPSGVELLFSTPWRERADAIRAGLQAPVSSDSIDSWMEQYRGGWQTLCPNAGPPREYRGATLGFHGEASVVPWTVVQSDASSARLRVQLFTVPLRIERTVSVEGPTVSVVDILTNPGNEALVVDYSHHPAFGGGLLDGECVLASNAGRFVPDPATNRPDIEWPDADLATLPAEGVPADRFGWLTGFPGEGDAAAWASVTNPALGLGARVSWDPTILPYAWWWQEFTSSQGFPWFGKARVFAIEPASTQTSGPDRASVMAIAPRASVRVPVSLSIETEKETESDSE